MFCFSFSKGHTASCQNLRTQTLVRICGCKQLDRLTRAQPSAAFSHCSICFHVAILRVCLLLANSQKKEMVEGYRDGEFASSAVPTVPPELQRAGNETFCLILMLNLPLWCKAEIYQSPLSITH